MNFEGTFFNPFSATDKYLYELFKKCCLCFEAVSLRRKIRKRSTVGTLEIYAIYGLETKICEFWKITKILTKRMERAIVKWQSLLVDQNIALSVYKI